MQRPASGEGSRAFLSYDQITREKGLKRGPWPVGFTSYIHEACCSNRSSSRGNCGVRDTFSLPPNLFHLLSSLFPFIFLSIVTRSPTQLQRFSSLSVRYPLDVRIIGIDLTVELLAKSMLGLGSGSLRYVRTNSHLTVEE